MRWHSAKETVKIASNSYYLVKYIDQFGSDDVADCILKDGKFINIDKNFHEELSDMIAWCPFEEIEEYLNSHNLWRSKDDECYYFNNLGIVVSTTDDGESITAIPAIGKVINGEKRFYDLYEYEVGSPVGVVYGWIDINDIRAILDGVPL